MRRAFLRCLFAVGAALGLLAGLPTTGLARDNYVLTGQIEIRIVGANGQARDFLAISPTDRQGASTLIDWLASAPSSERTGTDLLAGLPHYRLGIGRLGYGGGTTVWPRLPETTLAYYVGDSHHAFAVLDGAQFRADSAVELPADVTAMIDGHLDGLPPLNAEIGSGVSTAPWGMVLGAFLLALLVVVVWEDRRRWVG